MVRDYQALAGFLAGRRAMPFAFGRHANDCASFAAGAIKAATGRDVLGKTRWTTRLGAVRIAKREGSFAAAVTKRLTPIAPAAAHRGDIAGVPDDAFPGGIRLMVVDGAYLVGPGEHGLLSQDRATMTHAWSADA